MNLSTRNASKEFAMFRNFARTSDDDRHDPIGALFAGTALLMLPLLRLFYGSAEPIEVGYWIPFFFGVVMVLHGSAGLKLYHRFEPHRGGNDAS